MNPEDRVLVGVIKAKRDLTIAHEQHWYRIPEGNAPKGIDAEFLAFFLSGRVFGERSGGIHYFAERKGMELVRRKDLLPGRKHSRDENLYHKIQLGPLQEKIPPVWNRPKPHRFAFIYTTWDRFQRAKHIRELYSSADYFVDRVFHVLRQQGLKPRRSWEVARSNYVYPRGAQIRVLADRGDVVASTTPVERQDNEELIYLKPSEYKSDVTASAEAIVAAVNRLGGPKWVETPVELG